MLRIILYLVAVLAVALLCIFLARQHDAISVTLGSHVYTVELRGGAVYLTLGSWVYDTSLAVALGALLIAALALYFAYRLLRFLVLLPVSAFALSRRRREAKADAAITKGLVAAASGDLVAAARHAATAERLAAHEPLALLLKAQAAQLQGKRQEAKQAFSRMAQIADTRGLGLRGLFVEASRRGDAAEASRHAAQATELEVFLPWAHEATLLAQCRARDWAAAIATLEHNHRLGATETAEMRRAKAALLAARALDLRNGEPREALKAAKRALAIDPGLTPAAVTAAALLAKDGRQRKAARIIEAAWRSSPHPDLAEAYLGLEPRAGAADRLRQMAKLANVRPEHEESRVALAQSQLAAREFAKARASLAPFADNRPTARVCLLMAEIEEAENGMTGLAREWLARAAHAPRDPAWIAEGVVAAHWEAIEPDSGRIGVYAWQHPPDLVPPPRAAGRLAVPAPASASAKVLPPPKPADPAPIVAADVADAKPNGPVAPEAAAAPEQVAAPSTPEPEAPRPGRVALPLERPPDDPGPEPTRDKGL